MGGTLTGSSNTLTQSSNIPSVGINFEATYTATSSYISISALVTSVTNGDRALSVGFALPVNALVLYYIGIFI